MTKILLDPGQFIFGRFAAAHEVGIKPSTLVDCMRWLKTNNTINIKSSNKFSIVTVVNWALYQTNESAYNTNFDTNPTIARHQSDTNNNVDNDNIEMNGRKYYGLQQALVDFSEHRLRLGKPFTNNSWKLLLVELNRLASSDEEKIAIIYQSINNDWIGVFSLKPKNNKPFHSSKSFAMAKLEIMAKEAIENDQD